MPSFKDRLGHEWVVMLDAPSIEEIRDEHGVNLVAIDKDPLLRLRDDPLVLVTVISVLCREQIAERKLSAVQFAKRLPSPPDPMLEALREAVISFFPSGRASHVREVIAKYDEMALKLDQIAEEKIAAMMNDPQLMKLIDRKADQVMREAIREMGREVGT
jgi:hypothetical protein